MAFPESVKQQARLRSRGICQCVRETCPHVGPCKASGAEYHHKKGLRNGGGDELSNCQFLCKQCHGQAHGEGSSLGRI